MPRARIFRRKGSRCWYCWVPKPGGGVRPVTTNCTDERAALTAAAELERRAVDPAYGAAAETTLRRVVGDYLADLRRQKRSADTLSFNAKVLGHVVRLLVDDGVGEPRRAYPLARLVDHPELCAYVDARQAEGVMNTTVLKELRALGAAWTLARKNNLVAKSWADIKPKLDDDHKDRTRWLPPLELVGLATILPRHRMAAAAYIAASGCDDSALFRARVGDAAADRSSVRIRGTKRASRDRVVPIPLPEQRLLLDWAIQNADGGLEGRLFSAWPNRRNDLADAAEALGIARVSPNDLRRTYAKWCRLAGIEPALVGPAMGHIDGRMVERVYGALTPEELAQVMARRVAGAQTPAERLMRATSVVSCGSEPDDALGEELATPEDDEEIVVRGDGIEPPTRGFSNADEAYGSSVEVAVSSSACATNESADADEPPSRTPAARAFRGLAWSRFRRVRGPTVAARVLAFRAASAAWLARRAA